MLSSGGILEQLPNGCGVAVPIPFERVCCGGLSYTLSSLRIAKKLVQQVRKLLLVSWVAEHKSVHATLYEVCHTGTSRSNHGQAAGHSFRNWQAEGVFAAWADVQIRRRVEIEYVWAGRLKVATLQDTELIRAFTERVAEIIAGNKDADWQIAKRGHGFENRFEPLDAPIVADEQKHEILFAKIAAQARGRAESEPHGRRKLRRVHAVGDDPDIPPVKKIREQKCSALGDGRERDFRVRVDAAFQGRQKGVVSAAMEAPEKPGPGGFAFIIAGQLLEAMEKRVNDDDIRVGTIHSR